MTLMRINVVIVFLGLLQVTTSFRWNLATVQSPGTTIEVCNGDNVTLDWNYSVQSAEHVINLEWYFQDIDRSGVTMIATQVGGNFLTIPTAQQQLQFLPNAGIRLLNVERHQYTGTYSVHVNVNLHGSVITETMNATVRVAKDDSLECSGTNRRLKTLEEKVDSLTRLNTNLTNTLQTLTSQVDSLTQDRAGLFNQLEEQRQQHLQDVQKLQSQISQLATCSGCDGTTAKSTTTTTTTAPTKTSSPVFSNCLDVFHYNGNNPNSSGVYNLTLATGRAEVYCDQELDGGGWTVIHRRFNGLLDFHLGMQDYVNGFGNARGEYWLGLENISQLTSGATPPMLRIDIRDTYGREAYAVYKSFYITDNSTGYKLHTTYSNGTAGNALAQITMNQNGWPFTTYDSDNDGWTVGNCAARSERFGGWWFGHNCGMANLNGRYNSYGMGGMLWYTWKHDYTALKYADMKIRPAVDVHPTQTRTRDTKHFERNSK